MILGMAPPFNALKSGQTVNSGIRQLRINLSAVVPSGVIFITNSRTDPEAVLLGLLSGSFLDKKMVDEKGGNLENHPP